MNKLIITFESIPTYSFAIIDLNERKITHKKKKIDELKTDTVITEGHQLPFRPYGVDYDSDYIYVVCHEKMVLFDKQNFEYVKNLNVKLFVNTHQMVKQNNVLYICNTTNDSIGVYDIQTGEQHFIDMKSKSLTDKVVESFNPNNERLLLTEHDEYHISSLTVYDNKVYFCCGLSKYRNTLKSKYYYFDLLINEFVEIISAGNLGHNVCIVDNILYSLSSSTHELLKINLTTRELTTYPVLRLKSAEFIRGMEVYGDDLLIGHSERKHGYRDPNDDIKNAYLSTFNMKTESQSFFMSLNGIQMISDFKLYE